MRIAAGGVSRRAGVAAREMKFNLTTSQHGRIDSLERVEPIVYEALGLAAKRSDIR